MKTVTRLMAILLVLSLCGVVELAAQTAQAPAQSQPAPQTPEETSQEQPDAQQQQPATTMDPAQGPLQPAPSSTTLPDAPSSRPQDQNQAAPAQPQTQEPVTIQTPRTRTQPVGAAAAEKGTTTGGAASRPAGSAIAPARQKQRWSWLIKTGAIVGAGIAIGTVVALSKGSPSVPR